LQTIGWIGTALFLLGGWLIGSEKLKTRIVGCLSMASCNVLYTIQAIFTNNWSLLFLSVIAALLQIRAAYKWKING
jgi:hypothetical protein